MLKKIIILFLLFNSVLLSSLAFLSEGYINNETKSQPKLNWKGFLKCLRKSGAKRLGVEKLVEYLENEDYVQAMTLIPLGFQGKYNNEYERCHQIWHPW